MRLREFHDFLKSITVAKIAAKTAIEPLPSGLWEQFDSFFEAVDGNQQESFSYILF